MINPKSLKNLKPSNRKGKLAWNKGKKGWKNSGSFRKGHPDYIDNAKRMKNGKLISNGLKKYFKKVKGDNWNGHTKRDNTRVKKWRMKVFVRDGFACQNCGVVGIFLNAHHIKWWSTHPKLRFVVSNGITLCRDCHRLCHKKK
jgi:5-methylcytosine-specific restriction endonuclease McrA